MIEKDFHGYTVKAALKELESLVGRIRMENKTEQVTLITGRSEMKKEFFRVLSEDYKLEPIEPMYNSGVIQIEIS